MSGIRLMPLVFCTLLTFTVFATSVSVAQAATRTWDGGSVTTQDWSDCDNWSDDTCPISTDSVLFDGTSFEDATVDSSFSGIIAGLTISAGYTGTTTLSRNLTNNGAYSQADGGFALGSQTLTQNGSFTISNGNFDEGTGTVIFRGNSSTINVPTSETFYNIQFLPTSAGFSITISSGDTLYVTNSALFTDGVLNTGTVEMLGGTAYASSTFDAGNAKLLYSQGGDETLVCDDDAVTPALTVAKSSGTLTYSCTTLNITKRGGSSGPLTVSGGTFSLGTGKTLKVNGSMTISTGTFDTGSSRVVFNGNSATLDVNVSQTFYDVDFNNEGGQLMTISSGDTFQVTNMVRYIDGAVFTGTVEALGAKVYASSTFDGGSSILKFAQGGDETLTCDTNAVISGLTVSKSSGTLDFTCSTLKVGIVGASSGAFSLTGGTFAVGSSRIEFSAGFTISGGTFDGGTGTVAFKSNGSTVDVVTSQTFYNIDFFNNPGWFTTIASGDTLIGTNSILYSDGQILTGTVQAEGDVTVLAAFDGGSSPLVFSGTKTQSFDLTGATGAFNADTTVNKTGGQVNLLSALVMDASSQDIIIREGTFDLNGNDLTVSGSGGTFIVEDGGNLQLQGGESLSRTPDLRSGSTVTYDGADTYSSLAATSTYYSLAITGSGTWSTSTPLTIQENFTQSAGTFSPSATTTFSSATSSTITTSAGTTFTTIVVDKTATSTFLAGNISLTGNLGLSGGTLDVSSSGCSGSPCSITVSGHWINSGGTLEPRTGTVTMNGSNQSITGDTTFYNLTKTVSSADSLTFGAGDTQTVGGTWTAQGASGDLLSLRSSETDTQWEIDPQGTRTIQFLDVQDSNNINATVISAGGTGSVDSLNNTNWDFSEPVSPTPSPSPSPSSGGGSGGGKGREQGIINKILRTNPGESLLVGPLKVAVGYQVQLLVIARSDFGTNVGAGNETVRVSVAGLNAGFPAVIDNGDGTYTARYLVRYAGTDLVTATINGSLIGHDTDKDDDGVLHITVQPASGEPQPPPPPGEPAPEPTAPPLVLEPPPSPEQSPSPEPFALESGLTSSCDRAFAWNRPEGATVYRKIGTGHDAIVATLSGRTPWYVDVDPIYGSDLAYRFVFEVQLEKAVTFTSAELSACLDARTASSVVEQDIDDDGNLEQYIGGVFQDTDGSSAPVAVVDDGLLVDTNGDGEPDVYWNPGIGVSPIIVAGDRLVILDGSLTATTMYQLPERPSYAVFLRLLAAGGVALAADATMLEPFEESLRLPIPFLNSEGVRTAISTIGVATGASLGLLSLLRIPLSIPDAVRAVSHLLVSISSFAFSRKRRRPWGTLYDSVTKEPLDPGYMQLFDQSGREVATAITDLDGRFGFLAPPGTYTLKAQKSHYAFPSTRLQGRDHDVMYTDLYFGGPLIVPPGGAIARNIPMDPLEYDFNQEAKRKQHLMRYTTKLDPFVLVLFDTLFYGGFLVTLWQAFAAPRITTIAIVTIYTLLLALRLYLGRPPLYGTVTEGGEPLSFAVVRLFNERGEQVSSRITDAWGRYFILVPPGPYQMTVERRMGEEQYEQVYEGTASTRRGVVNGSLELS